MKQYRTLVAIITVVLSLSIFLPLLFLAPIHHNIVIRGGCTILEWGPVGP